MAISQNFPNTRPSLNLNFARSKTLDPRITFIRTQTGSEASYVDESGIIRYASADEPRFDHDPVTGKCLGLMIEEQQTNLFPYSVVSSTGWTISNSTLTANDATAPDGTNTAARIQVHSPGSSNGYVAKQSLSVTSGTEYTFSFYVKSQSGSSGTWGINIYDHGGANIGHHRTDVNVTGEWTRVSYSYTPTSGTINVYISDDRDNTASISDAYVWGAQIESDKDASSYIPTSGGTKTRNADNVWMDDITDFFNPSQGTSVIKFSFRYDGVHNDPFRDLFGFKDHSKEVIMGVRGNSNNSQFFFTGYDTLFDDSDSNGIGDFSWLDPTTTRNLQHTVAVSYASTYFRLYRNDETSFSSINTNYGIGKAITDEYIPHINPSTGITTSNFTSLGFGHSGTSTTNSKINCNIESFAYYPSEVGVDNIKTFTRDQ